MKRNIFIFENTNSLHIEESLVTLLDIFKENNNVQIVLNDKAYTRVSNNSKLSNYIIKSNGVFELLSFIKQVHKDDIVIFPTISTRNISLLYFLSFFIKNNIYYIRNSNSWIKYANHQKEVKYKLLSNITTFFKKQLLKKAYQIFVANNNLKSYLQKNGVENIINIVPYKIFDETYYKKSNYDKKINIVIPGAIDISKKDLPLVREATKLLSNEIKKKINLILLGKPSRDIDKVFCKEWKTEMGSSLTYYTEFISDDDFTSVLQEAHFILGVLEIEYEDKYNKEIYGQTKDTGIEAQAIAYGKPLIINEEFQEIDEINSSTCKFKDFNELNNILEKITTSNYNEIATIALDNCKKISLEKIRKNMKDF